MDFEKLIAFDRWANERVFKAFQKLEDSELRNEIEKLFSHILAAQIIWKSRIDEEKIQIDIWPNLSLEEMKSFITSNADNLKQLLSRERETIRYQNSKGASFSNSVQDILTHLIIHGQHHRAQIAKLLREAGEKPPATDYIFFLRTIDN